MERRLIEERERAIRTVEDITRERDAKGNANVTAGRYGEMVANMVRYAESEMALNLLKNGGTAQVNRGSILDDQSLPSSQHIEPESVRGQNIINPT